MRKKDYYPDSLLKLREFLELQAAQWPLYGAALGYTQAEIADEVARINGQLTEVNTVLQMQADVAKAVAARNAKGETFETSYRLTVKRAKLLPDVDPTIFKAFGWDGNEISKVDLDQAKPVITHIEVLPGEVHLDFVRRAFDGIDGEYSATGTGDWTKGEFDNRSPYEDKRPVKNPGQPEVRYYRFRYRYKGEPVGQYSDVVRAVISE
jgi:hypothetical protein